MVKEDDSWNHQSISLAVQIPSNELDAFKQLSGLSGFVPGPPEGWMDKSTGKWQDNKWLGEELSRDLARSTPDQFEHVPSTVPSNTACSRGVVVQKLGATDVRIYLGLRSQ